MFSPTYFAARQRTVSVRAEDFCAVNAVVYRRRGSIWAFTEPDQSTVERRRDVFALSGSVLKRSSDELVVDLNERSAVFGGRLRGRVRIQLCGGSAEPTNLDTAGVHRWWPIGARANAAVELDQPKLHFRGPAYHDCNFGDSPLEHTFASWNWSRATLGRDVAITYDVRELDQPERPLGLRITPSGVEPLQAAREHALERGRWGVGGSIRGDGHSAAIQRRLEDTPFYTRSIVENEHDGRRVLAVHESLDMQRFTSPWVQALLPFRLRRGWRA